jgi:hypothetical protein
VRWNGLDLNPGYRDDGLLVIVTNVTGWYGTPVLNGNDLERIIADGAVWGPKVIGPRLVTVEGAVTGPRDLCLLLSRDIAALASAKGLTSLVIGEDGATLAADVRAGTEQMTHEWSGPVLFRYSVVLTAADARLYEESWNTAVVTTGAGIDTGRTYPRLYRWAYGAADLPNSATLANPGNTFAPVWAVYSGPLSATRLTDGDTSINVAAIADGQQIMVNCETLAATAAGGFGRASYVLAGSQPMTLAPRSSETWRLYGTGTGQVVLTWRGAFA